MKKAFLSLIVLCFIAAPAIAQDCSFKIADDDTLKQATTNFHDIMAPLQHGPVQEGDMRGVRDQVAGLVAARDAIMKANLPKKNEARCATFSALAKDFSASIDTLDRLVQENADDAAVKDGFAKMHGCYEKMLGSLVTAADLAERFHGIMSPLWHEAYEAKDVARIKKEGLMLVRLAAAIEKACEMPDAKTPKELVAAVGLLKSAIEGGSDAAVLESLAQVHEAYHALIEELQIEHDEANEGGDAK